jgi:type II secretory pathway component PulF
MAIFLYEGFDSSGAKVSGEIDAQSVQDARTQLSGRGVLVKAISPLSAQAKAFSFGEAKLGLADVEFLTSELSVLLDAGLKIDKGIELLKNTTKKPALYKLLGQVSKDLKGGKQLSQSLAAFPQIFDPLYVNLVGIGEATGALASVFRELAADLAFRRELQQKIITASTYPLIILFVCLMSVVFIFNYVVPNMSGLFEGVTELPWYTAMLLNASAWLISYQWYLLVGLVALVPALLAVLRKPEATQSLQRLAIRTPGLRGAILLIERIRFNSGLSMMLKAGIAIDRALELSSLNIRNTEVRREIAIAIAKVKQGDALSGCLRQTSLYPDFYASLLAVGEESGELGRIFNEIAIRSQREFSQWVTRFTSLLEPLLIVVMGGLVGGVVVIMMLSITTVTDIGI